MESVRITEELSRLAAAAAERAEAAVRREVRGAIEEIEAELRRLLLDALPAARPEPTPEPCLQSMEVPGPGTFAAALLQPTVAIVVGGQTLHIHRGVLKNIPFFEAMLEGQWSDAKTPEVNLPCSAAEFGLLAQRLYTGETLGSPAAPVEGFALALRLAEAASMLLVDDQMPELSALLQTSVVTSADAEAAEAAAARLPDNVGKALQVLSAHAIPGDRLVEAAAGANTPEAQDTVNNLLATNRGCVDVEALGKVVSAALASQEPSVVLWGVRLAREHLNCSQATAAFRNSGLREVHSNPRCDLKKKETSSMMVLRGAFFEHLQRCAGAGVLAEALALGVEGARELPASTIHWSVVGGSDFCRTDHVDPLVLGETAAAGLVAALAGTGRERAATADVLCRMPPSQLAPILTEALLAALGPCMLPVVAHLTEGPQEAAKWATPARLAVLPHVSRVGMCVALLPLLHRLEPEVGAEVVRVLGRS